MSSNIKNIIEKKESKDCKAPTELLEPGIYPGTIVWSEKKMGSHAVSGVQSSSFLVRVTRPPVNGNQVNELYRAERPYHAKRKQVARVLKAEQRQAKKAEVAHKKQELRRLHGKTFVKAHVNAYMKARFREYQEAQEAAMEEVDDDDDDAEGEPGDSDYVD